jgi:hypothetical protein
MRKNIRTIGNMTKTHETIGAPALQIRFRTHVQNATKISLIKKIKDVLET